MQKDRNSSILIRVSLLTTFLCLIIMAYTSNQTYFSWRNYQKARELSAVQVVTQYFSDALKNFMFERGRMNVVLSTERPISDQNRDFLNQRRKAADEAFESGFLTIAEFFPDEADLLRREYASIDRLRRKLDAEALESRTARDGNARALWFSGCTDYIDTVIKKIAVIRELSHNDIFIFNCFDVIVDSLHFRSIVGNESSVITSAIASGRKLDDDFYMEITTMRGESLQLWSELETAIEHVGSEPLTMALEDVRKQYHRGLRAEQDRLLKLAHEGQLYEGAAKELANLSVPALDSIFRISEEAIHEIKRENQAIVHKALNGLFWGFSQLLAGILLVIIVPRYYKKQFVRPLNDIIQILEDIGEGKTDCRIPHVDRTDEIGKLAFGAKALKYSIIEEQSIKLELEQTVSKLEQLSVRDPLTGLFNRRYMKERFDEMENLYRRNGRTFSVIMGDIDNFKSINDRFGHDCGDSVLVHVAAILSKHCRESDVLARWGGEEFLFLLPDTDQKGAISLAERIRSNLEEGIFERDVVKEALAMTFGVAEYSSDGDIRDAVRRADTALLRGKMNGRNRVEA